MLIAAALAIPASAALVAEWRLDEGSGTTTYDSVSSTASDTVNGTWSAGVNSPALTFGGTQDKTFGLNRSSTDLGIDGTKAKTIVTWFKTTATGAAAPGQTIWGYSPTGGNTSGADLRFKTQGGALRFEFNGGAATNTISVADGSWHMAAMIIEAGDAVNTTQLALDGIFVATTGNTAQAINTGTGGEMSIGNVGGNAANAPFNGSIDSVGVFNTALSATDVAILNGLGRIGNNYMSDLAAAADLWADGGTATINGVQWQKVDSGLGASLGDWSQVGGANGVGSYITLDGSGGGIQIIPEPTAALLAGVGLLGLLRRRRA